MGRSNILCVLAFALTFALTSYAPSATQSVGTVPLPRGWLDVRMDTASAALLALRLDAINARLAAECDSVRRGRKPETQPGHRAWCDRRHPGR